MDEPDGRQPPNDLGAERVCLGAMMQTERAIEDVTAVIGSGDYYRPAHATIHAAIITAYGAGRPTAPVALAHELEKTGDLTRIGGRGYLAELYEAVPTVAMAGYYAGIVASLARQRRVDEIGIRLRQLSGKELNPGQLAEMAIELRILEHGGSTPTDGMQFVDGDTFTRHQDEQTPVWGEPETPVWASGESIMIFGPPGIGKSTLIHLLTFARLGLIPGPLGYPVQDDGGKLLYLAMDRPRQISRAMVRLVKPAHLPVLRERLIVWQGPLPFDITLPANQYRLTEICQALGAKTVVIDSVKDCVRNPSDEERAGGYNLARQSAVREGIEWVESHHNRKGQAENKAPNTIDDVYGSRWLTAGAGSVLCMWGVPGDPQAKLTQLKSPGEFLAAADVQINFWSGTIDWAVAKPSEMDYITAAGPDGVTLADVLRHVEGLEHPTAPQRHKTRDRLDTRVSRGRLDAFVHPVDLIKRYCAPAPPPALPPMNDQLTMIDPE
jgi:replicative DNA helicase